MEFEQRMLRYEKKFQHILYSVKEPIIRNNLSLIFKEIFK